MIWATPARGRTPSTACDLFCQECPHTERCCLCDYGIRRPLFLWLLCAVGTALRLATHSIAAVLPMGLSRRAVRRGAGLRCGVRLPALAPTGLIPLESVPHHRGDQHGAGLASP